MQSTDREIYIVIDGRQYRLEGSELTQTSGDNFQQQVTTQLEHIASRLGSIEYEQRLMNQKIDSLQTSVYWVLAAVGIFLASMTIPAIIAGIISAFRKPAQDDSVKLSMSQFADLLIRSMNSKKDG